MRGAIACIGISLTWLLDQVDATRERVSVYYAALTYAASAVMLGGLTAEGAQNVKTICSKRRGISCSHHCCLPLPCYRPKGGDRHPGRRPSKPRGCGGPCRRHGGGLCRQQCRRFRVSGRGNDRSHDPWVYFGERGDAPRHVFWLSLCLVRTYYSYEVCLMIVGRGFLFYFFFAFVLPLSVVRSL